MLKCASVYTYEIDDLEIAFEEIKTQLDEKVTLLEHSVGIVTCHPEFVGSGVLRYICENLPFETVGMTTAAQSVNGEAGELILTIFVMTSESVEFRTGVTAGLVDGELDAPVSKAVGRITAECEGSPRLVLMFAPANSGFSGDAYVEVWRQITPGVPVFGGVATDDTRDYALSETIHGGGNFRNEMSFVLCYGDINPRFIVGTLPHENVLPYKGEVTKSSGSLVHEINNMNAYKYFESIGFTNDGAVSVSYILVPFVIDQITRPDYDGVPVIRSLSSFAEDGTAVFLGNVDQGSTFMMLRNEPQDVLSVTRQKAEQINELSDVNGVLLFPCIARRSMTLRVSPLVELELVRDLIRPEIPFMMGYAGGEISPSLISADAPVSRFHNYSLIILVV